MELFPTHPEEQQKALAVLIKLQAGNYDLPDLRDTEPQSAFEHHLRDLIASLRQAEEEYRQVLRIAALIGQGLTLEDVLSRIYTELQAVIPFSRIGFSLIDQETNTATAYWAKSDAPELLITRGYSASLEGSSLATLIETREPRILNDLEEYLAEHPASDSTRRIVEEGHRSSLTCPLILNDEPIGFLFFSSRQKNAYENAHVHIFQLIASQLASVLERGRLIARLESQNEELNRANKMKNVFLGMASHDLRSPLAFIKMATTAILDPEMEISDAQRDEFLGDVASQADHMLTLIGNLLDISRIESGTLTLRREEIDLPAFLKDVVQCQARLAQNKLTTVRLLTTEEGTIFADRTLIRQVLYNLITNAVKFSPPESCVDVSYQRTPAGWRFAIKDQGPGITEQDREQLFQYFTKLSARPTADESSHGLGLAISRQIVEAHGGEIGVLSPLDGSALFYFEIPDGD